MGSLRQLVVAGALAKSHASASSSANPLPASSTESSSGQGEGGFLLTPRKDILNACCAERECEKELERSSFFRQRQRDQCSAFGWKDVAFRRANSEKTVGANIAATVTGGVCSDRGTTTRRIPST